MSSYLLGSGPAVCRPFISRICACQLHPFPPSLSAISFQRSRALHSSQRSPPYRQWSRPFHRELPQRILFWILFTGAGISYSFYYARPLVLESDETFKWAYSEQKYLPPGKPFTLEKANEALRRQEDSHIVGTGSGVLRYDTMQLPSNPISEDDYLSASGHEDHREGPIRWMLFGIYDGHA